MGQQLALFNYGLPEAQAVERVSIPDTLPIVSHRNDSEYILFKRGNHSVIYEQRFEGKTHGYEVFKIRVQEERKVFGNVVSAREKWPSDADFGVWAWSCNLKRALERFNLLEGGKNET